MKPYPLTLGRQIHEIGDEAVGEQQALGFRGDRRIEALDFTSIEGLSNNGLQARSFRCRDTSKRVPHDMGVSENRGP